MVWGVALTVAGPEFGHVEEFPCSNGYSKHKDWHTAGLIGHVALEIRFSQRDHIEIVTGRSR